jgi:hypothetical protein
MLIIISTTIFIVKLYIYIITVPLSWSLGNFWDMPNQFGIIVNPLQGPMMLANPAK